MPIDLKKIWYVWRYHTVKNENYKTQLLLESSYIIGHKIKELLPSRTYIEYFSVLDFYAIKYFSNWKSKTKQCDDFFNFQFK